MDPGLLLPDVSSRHLRACLAKAFLARRAVHSVHDAAPGTGGRLAGHRGWRRGLSSALCGHHARVDWVARRGANHRAASGDCRVSDREPRRLRLRHAALWTHLRPGRVPPANGDRRLRVCVRGASLWDRSRTRGHRDGVLAACHRRSTPRCVPRTAVVEPHCGAVEPLLRRAAAHSARARRDGAVLAPPHSRLDDVGGSGHAAGSARPDGRADSERC